MARPRKDEARDTREDILGAALELFSQHSYAGTSMRQVARAVGVRESALYHHFPGKEDILRTLMERHGPVRADMLEQLDLDAVQELGARELLRGMAQFMFEVWATPTELKFARLMISEGTRQALPEALHPRTVLEAGRQRFAAFFGALMKKKLIREADPQAVAALWLGPLTLTRLQLYVMAPNPPEPRVVRKQVDGIVELFWRAVAPEGKK